MKPAISLIVYYVFIHHCKGKFHLVETRREFQHILELRIKE